jgi:hypothetical protein
MKFSNHSRLFRPAAAIAVLAALVCACGGGGGAGPSPSPNPGGSSVTLSGKIMFERPPFKGGTNGLDMANPADSPARGVVVQVLDATSNAVLASTNTDAAGAYSVSVPANRSVFVRAKAQMINTGNAPTFNFRVLNNTNSNALYALDGSSFNTGAADVTRNLTAATGWTGSTYVDANRAAGPFAILDTIYDAKTLILSANPTGNLPALDLYWSTSNKATANSLCVQTGDIGTSFYQIGTDTDDCQKPLLPGIYVLGDYANGGGDTDEFDTHVLAHEFGHYIEDQFARSDSIGGDHSPHDHLDMRVAFSEGWGDAFSAMATNDSVYRDSQSGVSSNFNLDLESDATPDGWFSELSVAEVLWDFFDAANEPTDQVALGFTPIYNAMTTAVKNTDALTSIFPLVTALRVNNPAQSADIQTILANEQINGTDDFGTAQSNPTSDPTATPIYMDITPNDPAVNVCSTQVYGSGSTNKLGNDKFFRLTLNTTMTLIIRAQGRAPNLSSAPAADPQIYVYKRGSLEIRGQATGSPQMTAQHTFAAGTYVIDVFDSDLQNNSSPVCMDVTVQGS